MLKSIVMFFLKIFLQGVYGRMMSRVEEEAESKKQGAILHAETTEQAAKVEINVEKAKEAVREKYANQPKINDPFNTDEWNNGAD